MKKTDDLRVNQGALNPIVSLFLGSLLVLSFGATLFAASGDDKDVTVKLREVSVFEQGHDDFLRGQSGVCTEKPYSEVKAYPKFKASKPIYGSVSFAGKRDDPASQRTFYYALD